MKWNNEKRNIEELIPSEYNPRKMSKKDERHLKTSMDVFGMADVIVINTNNHIIGGHQRYYILKKQGEKTVDVRVPERELTEEEERELNLRLNKNLGEFERDLLKDFDKDLLEKVGFADSEIEKIFEDSEIKPEVEFTTEVLEANNYVVFTFNNIMDWQVIKDKFDIKTVQSLDSEEEYHRSGVGRVVDGKKLLDALGFTENTVETEEDK